MATDKAVSIDVLSVEDRKIVHAALALKRLSVIRAAKAATNDVVRSAYEKESQDIYALMVRFS